MISATVCHESCEAAGHGSEESNFPEDRREFPGCDHTEAAESSPLKPRMEETLENQPKC